jgi:hypothetical protein
MMWDRPGDTEVVLIPCSHDVVWIRQQWASRVWAGRNLVLLRYLPQSIVIPPIIQYYSRNDYVFKPRVFQ